MLPSALTRLASGDRVDPTPYRLSCSPPPELDDSAAVGLVVATRVPQARCNVTAFQSDVVVGNVFAFVTDCYSYLLTVT